MKLHYKRPFLVLLILVSFILLLASPLALAQGEMSGTESTEEIATDESAETASVESVPDSDETTGDASGGDPVPDDPDDVAQAALSLWSAIDSKNWTLVFSFIVMLAVFVVRKTGVLNQVNVKVLPWVSIGLGVLVAVAAALIEGQDIGTAVVAGIGIGLSGSGLWSTLGKFMFNSSSESNKAPDTPQD